MNQDEQLKSKEQKPELLLPVGHIEAFHAAIEGGADAMYLGMKDFNARNRAKNFSTAQLQSLIEIAEQKEVRVYVTLNTLIKNEELPALLDTLDLLSQIAIDAVIVQDWGTLYLIKKYFSKLPVHASTQMANHNSSGVTFSKEMGIERVILARELTWRELESIREKTEHPLELFVHGALCYSFSGMCLFSSYLGGAGANRGLCAQPCRRLYHTHLDNRYLFSLKDNEQIDRVPDLVRLGVSSLKIEGRMKSAEYVYQVAKAYRMVIDDPATLPTAKELLKLDMGRAKTSYFMGGHVQDAMTKHPATGVFLGNVMRADNHTFSFRSHLPLEDGCRLRVQSPDGNVRSAFKARDFKTGQHNFTTIEMEDNEIQKGDQVYLAGLNEKSFSNKLPEPETPVSFQIPKQKKTGWIQNIHHGKSVVSEGLYVRIDSLAWLRKIRLESVHGLILKFTRQDMKALNLAVPFLYRNRKKLWIELPKFIPEGDLKFFRQSCADLADAGYNQFVIAHLSQKEIIPQEARFITSENVYTLNDAAIRCIQDQGAAGHIYPFETEIDNLKAGKDRSGILPLYFNPELFYSRMPIKMGKKEKGDVSFRDDRAIGFNNFIQDGVTIVIPAKPVSWVHAKKDLERLGFKRFLIDLSYEKPSQNILKRLLRQVEKSEIVQPSTLFNFKMGLK